MSPLTAQRAEWSVEVASGAQLGWWIYELGFSDASRSWHLGYDKTHLSFAFPLQLGLYAHLPKWRLGLAYSYTWLDDDEMLRPPDTWLKRQRYAIAREGKDVGMGQLGAVVSWRLLEVKSFHFLPYMRVGGLFLRSLHPERAGFGPAWFAEMGAELALPMGKRAQFFLRPLYQLAGFAQQGNQHFGARHRIYIWGLRSGFLIFVRKSNP
ncbi:MAG: hypothetical protein D6730_23590 [Bacteroidetes bacterium]|nr:MAG: hypothetical protein D6730_23590 [Bacteroidota bacterium]